MTSGELIVLAAQRVPYLMGGQARAERGTRDTGNAICA